MKTYGPYLVLSSTPLFLIDQRVKLDSLFSIILETMIENRQSKLHQQVQTQTRRANLLLSVKTQHVTSCMIFGISQQ